MHACILSFHLRASGVSGLCVLYINITQIAYLNHHHSRQIQLITKWWYFFQFFFFFFFFFSKKKMGFEISCKQSPNLHEISKPFSWKKFENNISVYHLLRCLPSMQSVKPCPTEPRYNDYNLSLQTVQIQINWLLKKPTDLDLHCLSFSMWFYINSLA